MENRVEEGIREWRVHDKRLREIFGDSIKEHHDLGRLQLDHYRAVLNKPLVDITSEEKTMRKLLKGEVGRMEKALYPSRLVRMVRGVVRAIAPRGRDAQKQEPKQATLVIKEAAISKRNISPHKAIEKNKRVKHNLIPKKKVRQSRSLKR